MMLNYYIISTKKHLKQVSQEDQKLFPDYRTLVFSFYICVISGTVSLSQCMGNGGYPLLGISPACYFSV